jgi:hypothetical protein
MNRRKGEAFKAASDALRWNSFLNQLSECFEQIHRRDCRLIDNCQNSIRARLLHDGRQERRAIQDVCVAFVPSNHLRLQLLGFQFPAPIPEDFFRPLFPVRVVLSELRLRRFHILPACALEEWLSFFIDQSEPIELLFGQSQRAIAAGANDGSNSWKLCKTGYCLSVHHNGPF